MSQFDRLFDLSGISLERLRTFLRVEEAGNLSKAALGDVTKQSQYSRQIKELEGFFGAAFTRRVGRRIEITEDGHRLAAVIRRHFRELDEFREAMSGRSITVRIGTQGSVIDWLLAPRLGAIRQVLGNAVIEMEQQRTLDVVQAVSDGRLDFGIVREDAVASGTRSWPLGGVGYAVFAAKALWKGCAGVQELFGRVPVAELLPGGQFSTHCNEWRERKGLHPQIAARVASFTDLARVVRAAHAAAVLPDIAAVDFDPKQIRHERIPELKTRRFVLIANARNLDRVGRLPNCGKLLSERLMLE